MQKFRKGNTIVTRRTDYHPWIIQTLASINAAKRENGPNSKVLVTLPAVKETRRTEERRTIAVCRRVVTDLPVPYTPELRTGLSDRRKSWENRRKS